MLSTRNIEEMCMKKLFLALALLTACFAFVPAAEGERNYVRFYNYSDYEVVRIHATFSDSENWGRNLMSGYVMRYNQYFDINTNYRDYYDLRVETRGGLTCTVKNVWMDSSKVFVFDGNRCYVRSL